MRDYPLELRHRDGGVTSVMYNASVYRDNSGNVIGVFAAARDVTARKRAEDELRQSEQRFSSMLEAVRDYAIIFLEPDGCVASWNKGAERIGLAVGDVFRGVEPGEMLTDDFFGAIALDSLVQICEPVYK